jgi:hypothetical protein
MVLSYLRPKLNITFSNLYYDFSLIDFCHHFYISHPSADGGLSGQEHVAKAIIKIRVCVMVTSPFLFVRQIFLYVLLISL